MAYILNIETATDICSIALSKGADLLVLKEAEKNFTHASEITLLIDAALKEAGINIRQLDAVALSQGPGSYTGLRIGTSTAKGICYALDIPMIAVDTLAALAMETHAVIQKPNALYFPMIDARRMEVYTAGYDANGEKQSDLEAKIIDKTSFSNLFEQKKAVVFSGNGAVKCKEILTNEYAFFYDLNCSAQLLVRLAYVAYQANNFVDMAYFSPLYFKAPNITSPKKVL